MKWILLSLTLLSLNSFAHDIEDKDILKGCIAIGVISPQVCPLEKEASKKANEAYEQDRSWQNLAEVVKTKAMIVKCYSLYNAVCVTSMKQTINEFY